MMVASPSQVVLYHSIVCDAVVVVMLSGRRVDPILHVLLLAIPYEIQITFAAWVACHNR